MEVAGDTRGRGMEVKTRWLMVGVRKEQGKRIKRGQQDKGRALLFCFCFRDRVLSTFYSKDIEALERKPLIGDYNPAEVITEHGSWGCGGAGIGCTHMSALLNPGKLSNSHFSRGRKTVGIITGKR